MRSHIDLVCVVVVFVDDKIGGMHIVLQICCYRVLFGSLQR